MIKIIREGEAGARCSPPVTMTVVTDAEEVAAFRARQARVDRNAEWLPTHASEIYRQHRGKHICIAGQEVFVADTAQQALALANAAHADDDGRYLRYIPKEKPPRIYAH